MNRGTPTGTARAHGAAQDEPTGHCSPAPAAGGAAQAVDADRQVLAKMAAIRRILGHSVLANSAFNE